MMLIMYNMINFMIDDFDNASYCENASYYNFDNASYCENAVGKFNSYECILSNFKDSSLPPYMLSEQTLVDKFVYDNYLNNCINVLIVFFVTSTSLLFSILIVSICVYQKMINQFVEKYNANRECYEYDTYFFEYLDEFNELNSSELVDDYLNSLECKYIKQKTPKGDVLMNYNNLNSSFDYYCKKSNSINFMYLDVVSRIYAVKYDCKKLYVDNYDNFELIKDYYNNVFNNSSQFDTLIENNIFYNKLNKKNKSKQEIEYVSNKYKYRGTFDDFNNYCKVNNYKIHTQDLLENDIFVLEKTDFANNEEIILNSKETINEDPNNISFKTFKNIAMSSKN